MTSEEFRELHAYFRQTLRNSGLGEIDELITERLRGEREGDYDRVGSVFAYLDALDTELALRSRSTVGEIINRLNDVARAELAGSGPIETLAVELEDDDRAATNLEELDLRSLPNLEPIRGLVRDLRDDLYRELELP